MTLIIMKFGIEQELWKQTLYSIIYATTNSLLYPDFSLNPHLIGDEVKNDYVSKFTSTMKHMFNTKCPILSTYKVHTRYI